jgi:hypothetical protein
VVVFNSEVVAESIRYPTGLVGFCFRHCLQWSLVRLAMRIALAARHISRAVCDSSCICFPANSTRNFKPTNDTRTSRAFHCYCPYLSSTNSHHYSQRSTQLVSYSSTMYTRSCLLQHRPLWGRASQRLPGEFGHVSHGLLDLTMCPRVFTVCPCAGVQAATHVQRGMFRVEIFMKVVQFRPCGFLYSRCSE